MLSLVDPKIDRYSCDHSTLPSALCAELEAFTLKSVPMAVMLTGPLVGSFLQFLIRLLQAKRVLEIGCYTGYSALVMAEALPSDGQIITLDKSEEYTTIAKKFWAKSPHGKKITLVIQDAMESIKKLSGPFDFVFLDADKQNYVNYTKVLLPMLSKEGCLVADNCLFQGEILEPTERQSAAARGIQSFNSFIHQHKDLSAMLLPVRDGLFLVRKK